ncbi:SPP1 gp7 family putative phage head morphogenesis protein [Paenibacillus sp. DS2015]|uniref:minor capsid protein n=1 Tax=Paenibacillus sp. DS2015 TaxID=3373917 RepID=UPI003D22A8F8
MKPTDYWKKRSEQIARRQFIKADAFEIAQRKEYDKATKSMQRDIEVFYQRYSTNNEVTMSEARKQLTNGELKEFKMTLEEFTEKAKDNADGRWTQELNNVYYKTRVTRLEALQTQIGQHSEMLAGSRQESTEKLLGDIYTDTYYRNIYEIHKGIGIGGSFAHVDDNGLKSVLESRLDGRNWSQRIWDDRSKVRKELQRNLSQSFIRGDSIDRTVKSVVERMNVSRSNAERLVQTESAFFAGQATMAGYKESGVVQQYEVLATLDTHTSSVCRSLDGLVFKLSEMEVNVNYPPFHARCRTTTVAYFDDDEGLGERIAMDPDGSTYFVPDNMKYEDWYQKHVVDKYGKDEADIMRKKVMNKSADRKNFLKHKEVLGKDASKSFAAFQDMKYNNANEWASTKRQFDTFDKIDKGEYSVEYKNKLKDTYRYFKKDGHEFTVHAINRTLGQKQSAGKVIFEKEDIRDMLNKPAGFLQPNGHKVRFENGIAIIQASDTNEIVSIVTRNKPKIDWTEA